MNFSLKFKGGREFAKGGRVPPPRPPLNEALTYIYTGSYFIIKTKYNLFSQHHEYLLTRHLHKYIQTSMRNHHTFMGFIGYTRLIPHSHYFCFAVNKF